jgi:hypothetical protein
MDQSPTQGIPPKCLKGFIVQKLIMNSKRAKGPIPKMNNSGVKTGVYGGAGGMMTGREQQRKP